MNEIMKIDQPLIMSNQFASLIEQAKNETNEALELAPTDENTGIMKKFRANLNKQFKEFEDERKRIKKEVLAPFEAFEAEYKNLSEIYTSADAKLKSRIDKNETAIKDAKSKEIKAYFDELAVSLGIDFFTFEQMALNITLSVSNKKLLEQVEVKLSQVKNDIDTLSNQPHPEKTLAEYKKCLDLNQAMNTVRQRMEAEQAELERQAKMKEQAEQQKLKQSVHPKEKPATLVNVEPVKTDLVAVSIGGREYTYKTDMERTVGEVLEIRMGNPRQDGPPPFKQVTVVRINVGYDELTFDPALLKVMEVKVSDEQEVLNVVFRAIGSRDALKEMKAFALSKGIKLESVK